MKWNFDISQAPKGEARHVERTIGKNTVMVEVYDAPRIIAAGNGGVVTTSRWDHKRQAWSMFAKDVPPMAWAPWPDHPLKEMAQ